MSASQSRSETNLCAAGQMHQSGQARDPMTAIRGALRARPHLRQDSQRAQRRDLVIGGPSEGQLLARYLPILVLVAYLVLGITYSAVAPIFESSDEPFHFPYVAYLAREQRLPVQDVGADSGWQALWHQEASQPPLYYAIGAALIKTINTHDLLDARQPNPHARIGLPAAIDNKNMVVPAKTGVFPWRDTALAVHIVRFFSVLLGAGTVSCTYLLARLLLPERPGVALAAMAVNAFLPMFLFISASVNNDNLVVFLSSAILVWLTRLVVAGRKGQQPRGELILLGVVIGLAALSKLSGLALLPLACLALLLRYTSPRQAWCQRSRYVADCAGVLLAAVLVAGWWYVRNVQLYGDPTGLNAMLATAGRRTATLGQLAGEFEGFRVNFWGLFGAVNVLMRPLWIYRVLDVVSLLALLGLGIAAWQANRQRKTKQAGPVARGFFLAAMWITLVFISLVRWTSMTKASQGRLMFPTIAALAVFFVVGLSELFGALHKRWRTVGAAILPAILLPLAIAAPFAVIRPAYPPPEFIRPTAVPASASRFSVTYGGLLRLLAAEPEQGEVRPGETVGVILYWEVIGKSDSDYSIFLHLVGRKGEILGQVDTYPGGGTTTTRRLLPGQVLRERYQVPVEKASFGGPVVARIEVGVYNQATREILLRTDTDGNNPDESVSVGTVMVRLPTALEATVQPLDANLDNMARLVGFDLQTTMLRPGASFDFGLQWEVMKALGQDYTVFIHLRNAAGKTVAQADGPPLGGEYPTSWWRAGEQLRDVHWVNLPSSLLPGEYRLVVGLYDPVSAQRLSVLDASGQAVANEVEVAQMAIISAP